MKNHYHQTHFLTSAAKIAQLPEDIGHEVAFAGRSNAGKSSVINTITQQKNLARTSKTPGRTQLINYFSLENPQQRLVDLPGYGYAKVNRQQQQAWAIFIDEYLRSRESLQGIILIMDIRHPMQEFDQQLLAWSETCRLPIHILLNKADKLSFGAAKQTLLKIQRSLHCDWHSIQIFSSMKKTGLPHLYEVLDSWLDIENIEHPD